MHQSSFSAGSPPRQWPHWGSLRRWSDNDWGPCTLLHRSVMHCCMVVVSHYIVQFMIFNLVLYKTMGTSESGARRDKVRWNWSKFDGCADLHWKSEWVGFNGTSTQFRTLAPSLTRKAGTESPTVKESRRYINLTNAILISRSSTTALPFNSAPTPKGWVGWQDVLIIYISA